MDQRAQVYSREEYATKQFWENRYKEKGGYFDWYAEFPQLKDTFENQYSMDPSNSLLMLGCGNSKLSQQMYEAGYHDILNVDISQTVIEQMRKISQNKGQTKMKWQVMDATNMDAVKDKSFDYVIDKGTLDALISGKNLAICEKMIQQSMRVLKEQGQLIVITYGSPQGRKKLFQNAIGFQDFDYYVTRVDLSTMSTLINLMRSNLDGKPLNQIMKDKEAMTKSVLEFNLVKMLRQNRKSEKSLIIWKNYEKKQVVFNDQQQEQQVQKIQEKKIEEKKEQTKEQNKQEKQTETKDLKIEDRKIEIPKQEKKPTYNPKKQCFCYVYSVKRKFAADYNEVMKEEEGKSIQKLLQNRATIDEKSIEVKGQESLNKIELYFEDKSIENQAGKAILYIQKKQNLTMNPVTIFKEKKEFIKSTNNMKLEIVEGKKSAIPIYNKSVFEITFEADNIAELTSYEKKLTEAGNKITEKIQLSHPNPREYAYMGVLMSRVKGGPYLFKFLKKYWYPTFKLSTFEANKVTYQFSVSPTLDLEEVSKIISETIGKRNKVEVKIKGFLNMIDPRVFAIFNMGSLVYNEGDEIPLQFKDFQQQTEMNNREYNGPTIIIENKRLQKIFAHFFCSF